MNEDVDQVIDEFLKEKPRARDLAEMIDALQIRRENFLREKELTTDRVRQKEWDSRIREVEQQIRILREEQAITNFVEDSIRVSIHRPRYDEEYEDWSGE